MDKGTISKTVEQPTEAAQALIMAMLDSMQENNVQPNEVLFVLGEAVIRLLATMAEPLGYGKKQLIDVFAKGLATAEVVFGKEGN